VSDVLPIDDEELAAQALAADVDAPLPEDALPWSAYAADDAAGTTGTAPLGDWYMPARVTAGVAPGWRRRVAIGVLGSIGLINAAGLCITYGHVTFG
jgi:hypothetical protein